MFIIKKCCKETLLKKIVNNIIKKEIEKSIINFDEMIYRYELREKIKDIVCKYCKKRDNLF